MARVLHGMPINTLPDPGELQPGDQIVAYREDTGKAYRSNVNGISAEANMNISDEFSAALSYAIGDLCIYNNCLYECTTAHSGDWNASDFVQVTVASVFEERYPKAIDTTRASSSAARNVWTTVYSFNVTRGIYIVQFSMRIAVQSTNQCVALRLTDETAEASTVYATTLGVTWNTLTRIIQADTDMSIDAQVYAYGSNISYADNYANCRVIKIA